MKSSTLHNAPGLAGFLLFIVVSFLCVIPSFPQTAATGLSGEVTDPTGAAIAKATVSLTSISTGVSRTTLTNESGIYSLPDMGPGTYTLTIKSQGFSTTTVSGIILFVGQPATRNVQLKLGTTSASVLVTAEAPLLNTTDATVGTQIDSKVLTQMPLNGRNFLQLTLLSPGVTYDKNGSVSSSLNANINPTTTGFNASGFPGDFNALNWDGTTMKEWEYATNAITPSVDALQEFQAATGSYSAAYGADAGGQINLVTKSGTNTIHGTVYEFLRNNILDAKNYFVTKGGAPPYKRNQFGATFGMPIIKNRTFLFASYDGFRQSKQVPELAKFPTLQELQGQVADLVPPGKHLMNPYTGAPYPGNNIPQDQIPSTLEKFLLTGGKGGTPWFPLPNGGTVPGFNFSINARQAYQSDQWIGRLDHRFNNKISMFGRFARESFGRGEPIINPNDTKGADTLAQSLAISGTDALKPNVLFDFTFGYLDMTRNLFSNVANKINVAQELGIQGVVGAPSSWAAPAWGAAGFTLGGNGVAAPQYTHFRSYDFNPTMTWNVGKQTLNFGAGITHYYDTFTELICPSGCPSFSGVFTGIPLGDFLLQTANFFEGSSTGFDPQMHYLGQGYYVQDDWKLSPMLTVNLGFRFESIGVPISGNNSLSNIYLGPNNATPVITVFGTPRGIRFQGFQQALVPVPSGVSVADSHSLGLPRSLVRGPAKNYMPRFGFAYTLPQSTNTVIRGGIGVYANRVNDNRWVDLSINLPFVGLVENSFTPSNFRSYNWQNPIANATAQGLGFFGNAATYKNAMVTEWSLTLERNMHDMLLSLGYLGNNAHHLPDWTFPNQATPGPGSFAPRQQYPNFGFINFQGNEAYSNYNSLQLKAQKRYAHGFMFLLAYTFSRALDNSSGDINGEGNGGTPQDYRNPRGDYGLSTQDARHRFVASYAYDLPFGRGHRLANGSVSSAVFGGWQVNGITTFQSGNPVFVRQVCNRANTNGGALRPDVVGSWRLDPHRSSRQLVSEFFKTSAFVNYCPDLSGPGPFNFGNAGRNIVIGPGINNWDFGLFKNIDLGGDRSLQFRTEAFNLFNHPIFGQPGGTAGTPQFGVIGSTALDSREIQVALKLQF